MFTPEQEARVREIVKEQLAAAKLPHPIALDDGRTILKLREHVFYDGSDILTDSTLGEITVAAMENDAPTPNFDNGSDAMHWLDALMQSTEEKLTRLPTLHDALIQLVRGEIQAALALPSGTGQPAP